MTRRRRAKILRFPENDRPTHWPVDHPLSCGKSGRTGGDGVPVTCPDCLQNVADNLIRVVASFRDLSPEKIAEIRHPKPKDPVPPRNAYQVVISNAIHPKTDGFEAHSGHPGKRTWWVFRSDGKGKTDIVEYLNGTILHVRDLGVAQAIASVLNEELM